jgi:hypothetical protein
VTGTAHWPKFRFDEVVRVIHVDGWPEGSEKLLGEEGAVMSFTPDPEMSGTWAVTVWLESQDEGVDFWEHQLESTGWAENEDEVRVLLEPEEPAEHFGAELMAKFLVERTEGSFERICAAAEDALRELIPLERVRWEGGEDDKYTDCWEITGHLWPEQMTSREAFEQLVAAYANWQMRMDDGWQADFSWWRSAAPAGEDSFLYPPARSCFIELAPWSDPTYHPVPKGRNEDPDWVHRNALQLPPPGGYG